MIRVRVGKRGQESIQVITCRYDLATGKNRQTVIANLPEETKELPRWVADKMRPVERANAEAFFAARRERLRLPLVRAAVAALVQNGEIVRDALRDPVLCTVVLEAAGWYGVGTAMMEICTALAAAGVPLRTRVKAAGRVQPTSGIAKPVDTAPDGCA